jgi:hypothetical protein
VQVGHQAVDDDGHGDGRKHERARDRVHVPNQSPRDQVEKVSVGKTASQIITASWCLVGGPGFTAPSSSLRQDRRLVGTCVRPG